jgi:hypothetical protein
MGTAIARLAMSCLATVMVANGAGAAVIVTFRPTETYSDVGRSGRDVSKVLATINEYLQRLGGKYLAQDVTLVIEVLDINLAGEERFGSRSGGVETRVLTGRADWPSMRVRYSLVRTGQATTLGEETIADMDYLKRPVSQPGELAYEKRMLEEWFKSRFVGQSKASR